MGAKPRATPRPTTAASQSNTPPSFANAELLSAADAKTRLKLDDYIHAWDDITLVDGDAGVDGNLVMDGVPGLFVTGNLTVKGDVVNYEGDFGPPLIVLGNLRARNLVGGGAEFVVCGDTFIKNTIYGHYNHGGIELRGDVKAKVVISDDHGIYMGGRVDAVTVDVRHNLSKPDFSPNDYQRAMAKGLIVDDWLDHDSVMDRILVQNKSPIKSGVKPSRLIVEQEIARAVAAGADVRELDLSNKNLHEVPEVLTELQTLEVLDLSDNAIESLPESFSKLTSLREYRHEGYALSKLPRSFSKLANLESLDLRYSNTKLPEDIDALANLKRLQISSMPGPWPAAIGKLDKLEELYAGGSTATRLTEFPEFVTELEALRVLDISGHPFPSIPNSIAAIKSLENLAVTGSLMFLDSFPDLAPLTNLKVLGFDGHSGHTGEPMPKPELLEAIWHLSTLEELDIARWGAKNEGHRQRGKLVLRDDVFANMPNLKKLKLAFNDITKLPASLYAIDGIVELDLRYVRLSDTEREKVESRWPTAAFRW